MTLLGRRNKPLPPSVRVHPDIPWVDPAELAPPWWRRIASAIGLTAMSAVLGVLLAILTGLILLGSFLLLDYLIS